jgi:AcrR family transcriptional regulator
MTKVVTIADPLEKIRMIGRIYIDFGLANPEYYDLMFIMRAPMEALKEKTGEDQCWNDGEGTFDFLRNIIQEGISKGLIRGADAELLSMYAWSTVHGMVSLHIRERFGIMEMTDEELKDRMFKILDLMIEGMRK